jgi:hypothetical protein
MESVRVCVCEREGDTHTYRVRERERGGERREYAVIERERERVTMRVREERCVPNEESRARIFLFRIALSDQRGNEMIS